jgi:hypothetical protein
MKLTKQIIQREDSEANSLYFSFQQICWYGSIYVYTKYKIKGFFPNNKQKSPTVM